MLADELLIIEAELRRLGCWEALPPSAKALSSTQPFSVDTLAFEQWLQWIMLPKMRALIEGGASLPSASGIGVMAQVALEGRGSGYASLLSALERFDRLIGES